MRTTRSLAAALLLAFAPAMVVTSAPAQNAAEDPTTAMARARFKEGVDFYDRGEFEQARASFLQAYALKKHPAVLLNLAWSCLKSGHALEAERYFKLFLAEGKEINDKQRADANDGVAQARAKVGHIEIVAGPGTEVTIDGDRIGVAPLSEAVPVEAGAHTVKFKSPDGATDTQSITVMGGDRATARSKIVIASTVLPPPPPPLPEPPATAQLPSPPAAPPELEERQPAFPPAASEPPPVDTGARKGLLAAPKNVAPAIILGVVAVAGYAGAAAALVFKQQAQDNADQVVAALNKARPSFQGCLAPSMVYASSCSAYATDTSNVNDDATAGNVAIGIGLAATAGAIVYWLVADKGEGGATTVRSVVTPVLGPHVGGLAFAATF